MVRRIRYAPWLTAAVVAAVLASGCSDTGSESQTAEGTPAELSAEANSEDTQGVAGGEPAEDPVSAEDPSDDGDGDSDESDPHGDPGDDASSEEGADEERGSPLGAVMAELTAAAFPDQAFSDDPMAAIEQMKYDCMAEQGFRYAIVDWAAIDAELEAALPSMAEEDYMSLRGYGVADSLDAPEPIESSYVDPNEAIQESLSANERKLWEEHLYECWGHAQNEVLLRPQLVYLVLQDELDALQERVDADPRVAEANAQWSECMAEQGHHYADQDEIHAYLQGIADPLLDRLRASGGYEHIDAAFQADLDALQALEAEIAVADLACEKHLQQIRSEVKFEHEQRFVDENQDRLAILREELPTMTLPLVR